MKIEYITMEDMPNDWPANETELHIDNINRCLDEFIKNPSYKTKEVLISLVSSYDLNQQSSIGLYRTTKYEVAQINSLFWRSLIYNITSLRTYLYELIGRKTRTQKMTSFLMKEKGTVEIPEFASLFPQLLLYHITYQSYILNNDKSYIEYLIEYAETVVKQENLNLYNTFTHPFISMINDISYFSCKKTSRLWAFKRDDILNLFKLIAKLIKLSKQNPTKRPLKGVLMTCISNYILKSRNNYNEDYIGKYISPEVAKKSIENNEIWINEISKLNDEREQKVIPELFCDNEWNTYKWAKKIDFTPQRKYYVSCFSKSINNDKMKEKYGSCVYGYKNDKIAEMISPISFVYNQNNKKYPWLSQVISFDIIYSREEAKEELIFLCEIIDCFDIPDEDKKYFLEEILQYWILSVKDSKWEKEKERRYVIFTYDNQEYHETDFSKSDILKIKSSLFQYPDFILGENPVREIIKVRTDMKRSILYPRKEYLYCEDCFNIDFDKVFKSDKIKNCPICNSANVKIENSKFT